MQKWEYVELRSFGSGGSFTFKSCLQIMPYYKVDIDYLKKNFQDLQSIKMEIRKDTDQLLIYYKDNESMRAYLRLKDLLGILGWEAFAIHGGEGDISFYYKRQI